jgi:site-specific recombinase XerD
MTENLEFPSLVQRFFVRRLMGDREVSPHTIAAYRDGIRQYLVYLEKQTGRPPAKIRFSDVKAETVSGFLDELERSRSLSARSCNLRLTTIHSFVRYASGILPERLGQFERIMAIPLKRFVRIEKAYLTRDEQKAVLAAIDRTTWWGRRDYLFVLVALQTGLRLSEMTSLRLSSVASSSAGSRVDVIGKGRKHRSVPLMQSTKRLLDTWALELPEQGEQALLFPNHNGQRLTVHGVRGIIRRCTLRANETCISLRRKNITMHSLRHTNAMDLLEAGVDCSVIAMWLGHESMQTTMTYLQTAPSLKEKALANANFSSGVPIRFIPSDSLLRFLTTL